MLLIYPQVIETDQMTTIETKETTCNQVASVYVKDTIHASNVL